MEHIIQDGCSTDDTLQLAKAYQQQCLDTDDAPEVCIASEPDNGLYDAMNRAMTRATGDYVLFLNAGDTFPSADTLETVAASVGEDETLPAVLYGDTDIVDNDGRFVRHRRLSPPDKLSWKSFKKGMLVCHQAFYARTDIAKNQQYDTRYRFSADVDWCIRIMKECERMGLQLCNTHMVVANYTEEGATTQHHRASLLERYRIMSTHYGPVQTFLLHCWFILRTVQ